jgi:hypothetical protein
VGLSGSPRPYLPSYAFLLSFDWQPSLFEASSSHGRVRCSLRFTYSENSETPLGFPRSAQVRCQRGGCLLYCGEMGVLHVGFVAPTFQASHSSPFQPFTVTRRHAASSEIHLRSPVRCFPSPVASIRLEAPLDILPRFPPRRYQRRREGLGTGIGHLPEGFRLTHLVRPRVAPQTLSIP